MPTYDYQCKECGHTFEEFQSMSSDLLVTCPSCGKPALKRLMAGGAGMIFKGSGFYLTDYKKSGSSSSASPETSDASKAAKNPAASPGASKPDSKPSKSS